jgi:hypothetical protein
VPSSNSFSAYRMIAFAFLFCASVVPAASAQAVGRSVEGARAADAQQSTSQRAPESAASAQMTQRAARPSEMECGGFIAQGAPAAQFEVIGSDTDQERRLFSQANFVYLNGGAQQGVRVGQEFSVVRPRGRFRSEFSRKSGPLGVYTQEVGRIRVVRVRDQSSVAEIISSCESVLLGDLLRPASAVTAELRRRPELPLDRFAEPSGRQTGRIVLARDGREVLTRDDVVFVDLGAEDNLRVGDYLTVYRPQEHGTFVSYGREMTANARRNYESREFRGGDFSNQAQRLRDTDGSRYGETVKTPDILRRRPPVPRKVVGELLVIRVEGRTATAVVTRVAQEIFNGDHVEVQ